MELPLYRNQLTFNVALGNTFLKLFRENNPFKENHTAAPLRQTDQHRQVHIHISAGCHFLLQSRDTDKYIYLENFNIISSTFSRNCTLSYWTDEEKVQAGYFLTTRVHMYKPFGHFSTFIMLHIRFIKIQAPMIDLYFLYILFITIYSPSFLEA